MTPVETVLKNNDNNSLLLFKGVLVFFIATIHDYMLNLNPGGG